ncbi:hypothetical protein [Cohnella hongkongensis]|uniref:Uncharacterized protein n=1 Tax=Cohnella hongkongensis TaxID=178337 RepID=A0ABV9FE53_9BACL
MRNGGSRRSAGAASAHARFAGEIAGKYGPIRSGVRSGRPLVFRAAPSDRRAPVRPERDRTLLRAPERPQAGPAAPAREKPEIRYRDVVRERPAAAGKDRIVEREKVVERERVVERRTVVVREAVRIIVEQRLIRETALSADVRGRAEEPAAPSRTRPGSSASAQPSRRTKESPADRAAEAAPEAEASSREREEEERGSFEGGGLAASRGTASPAGKSTFAERLAHRAAWPLSAKANAAFRRTRGRAPAAGLRLRVQAPGEAGSRKGSASRSRRKEADPDGGSRAQKSSPAYAQLLFVHPKLRADRGLPAGGALAPDRGERAHRPERPTTEEEPRLTARTDGTAEARHTGADRGRPAEGQRGSGLPDGVRAQRERPEGAPRSPEARSADGPHEGLERAEGRSVEASRDSERRPTVGGPSGHSPQEARSAAGPSDRPAGEPRGGTDGAALADGAPVQFGNRPVYRLSDALRPGLSQPDRGQRGSPFGRPQASGMSRAAGTAEPRPPLGGRSGLLRKPDADSPVRLIYRSLAERGRPVAAKRSPRREAKAAAGNRSAASEASGRVSARAREALPQAETRLGLTAGSLKLSHRLTGRLSGIGAAGRNAFTEAGKTAERASARANVAGELAAAREDARRMSAGQERLSEDGARTGERGAEPGGGPRSPAVRARRETGAPSQSGESDAPRLSGYLKAAPTGGSSTIRPGRLVFPVRRERTQDGRAGHRTAASPSGSSSRAGGIGRQGAPVPAERRDLSAALRGLGASVFPPAGAGRIPQARTAFLSTGPSRQATAGLAEEARRRGGTGAETLATAVRPASGSERSSPPPGSAAGALAGGRPAVGGTRPPLAPLERASQRRSPGPAEGFGGPARPQSRPPSPSPSAPTLRWMQLPRRIRDLPGEETAAQSGRPDAPGSPLAHAALSAGRKRTAESVPLPAAEPSASPGEPDASLEYRRPAPAAAAGTSPGRSGTPEPAAEISAEALQKAIRKLAQLHPDQLADQVYQSLVRRIKLEQRLHGF